MTSSYYELIGKIVQLDIENSTGRISWKGGHTEVLFACSTKTLTEAFCKHELSLFQFDYDSEDNMVVRNIEEER